MTSERKGQLGAGVDRGVTTSHLRTQHTWVSGSGLGQECKLGRQTSAYLEGVSSYNTRDRGFACIRKFPRTPEPRAVRAFGASSFLNPKWGVPKIRGTFLGSL